MRQGTRVLRRVPLPQRTTCSVGLTKTIPGGGGTAASFGQGGSAHLRRGGRNSQKSPETTSETFFCPEQMPTACADTTASSSCMTLTSQIKIGIFDDTLYTAVYEPSSNSTKWIFSTRKICSNIYPD